MDLNYVNHLKIVIFPSYMLAVHFRSSAETLNVPLPIFLLHFGKNPHKGRETGHFYCYMSFYLDFHCCLPVRPEHLGSTKKIRSLGIYFLKYT